METKLKLASIIAILLLPFAGHLTSNGWATEAVGYQNITVDQFTEMMDHKDFILINVHIPYSGEIEETDLLLPYEAIEQQKEKLPDDKESKIVVYCMSGPMGNIAAAKLAAIGYRWVFHFQGGMLAWKNAGNRLVNRSE